MRGPAAMALPPLLFLLLLSPYIALASKPIPHGPRLLQKPPSSTSSSSPSSSSTPSISSDSVLVALLDSPYTELAEMADEASLLQTLEEMVGKGSITILAPRNSFLERNLDPDFRQFLHEPGNIESLRALLRFHVIPHKIMAAEWGNRSHTTLAYDELHFSVLSPASDDDRLQLRVDLSNVIAPDAIIRRDGIVHGIDRLLIPRAVQNAYNLWKEGVAQARILAAVMPQGSPTPKTYMEEKAAKAKAKAKSAAASPPPPIHSIYYALAPGPSLAPAPAPGPSTGKRYFDGEAVVNDFISTLIRYGGYNEMADLLVNLTSLAPELAKLVSEGYRMTILAPNDEAMSKLTAEDLAAPGAPEQIIFYHIIPEYQTEESFYNAVRRFGKVVYQTLRESFKLVAQEEDGTVVFGEGKGKQAHLIDIDIFKDGRISVQGVDRVLSPPGESPHSSTSTTSTTTSKGRKLGEEEEDVEEEEEVEEIPEPELLTRVVKFNSNSPSKQGLLRSAFCLVFGKFTSTCRG